MTIASCDQYSQHCIICVPNTSPNSHYRISMWDWNRVNRKTCMVYLNINTSLLFSSYSTVIIPKRRGQRTKLRADILWGLNILLIHTVLFFVTFVRLLIILIENSITFSIKMCCTLFVFSVHSWRRGCDYYAIEKWSHFIRSQLFCWQCQ